MLTESQKRTAEITGRKVETSALSGRWHEMALREAAFVRFASTFHGADRTTLVEIHQDARHTQRYKTLGWV